MEETSSRPGDEMALTKCKIRVFSSMANGLLTGIYV